MKLGGHGGHTDLVGHVGQGLDVAEYLVDVCAVDREILTHGTTPESRVKFLPQFSVHDAVQSTTRQETRQTRAGAASSSIKLRAVSRTRRCFVEVRWASSLRQP